VLKNCLEDLPDMTSDPAVRARKEHLISEARILLDALSKIGADASENAWTDARVLAYAIKEGFLDTPHFKGNPHLCGEIATHLVDGGWHAVDTSSGKILGEEERIRALLKVVPPLRNESPGAKKETIQ
jgi:hypothetical protein